MHSSFRDIPTDEEAYPFMVAAPIAVPMRQRDVWKASKTWSLAFDNDPCMLFLRADGKAPSTYRTRATYISVLTLSIRNQIIFTVNGGASISVTLPIPTVPKTPINRLKDKLVDRAILLFKQKPTPEQQKRAEEAGNKTNKVVSEVLGDRIKGMLQVVLMATEPQSQGQGLGSAALGAVTALADSLGCPCWLHSSNVANDAFYNFHGFYTVGKVYLGDDNPAWTKEPILYQIMVRECTTKQEMFPSNKPAQTQTHITNSQAPFNFLI